MTRSEAIHEATERMCFGPNRSLVVQHIEAKGGDVLHWLDLCELHVVQDDVTNMWSAAFWATTEADEYVKSL
jgi:hypothetical protein